MFQLLFVIIHLSTPRHHLNIMLFVFVLEKRCNLVKERKLPLSVKTVFQLTANQIAGIGVKTLI